MFIYVGDITKRQKIIKLFAGFRPSIKRGLYMAKLDPEVAKWSAIVREAEYLERAEKIDFDDQRHEHTSGKAHKSPQDRRSNGNGESSSKSDKPRDGSHKGQPNSHKRSEDHDRAKQDHKPGQAKRQKNDKGRNEGKQERTSKLSPEKVAEYKAENRCFNCGEIGHFGRNCPLNKTAKASGSKPPGIQSNSIHFDIREMENLHARALGHGENELELNMIGEDVIMSDPEFVQGSSRDQAEGSVDSDTSSIHSSDFDQVQLFDSMKSDSSATDVESDDDSLPDLQPNPDTDDEDEDEGDDGVTEAGNHWVPTELNHDNGEPMNPRRRSDTWRTQTFGGDTIIVGTPRESLPQDEAFELTPEERLRWLERRLNRRQKAPRALTDHVHRQVEYLLEWMQPFPGDPSNCLQYRGWRFGARDLSPSIIGVWDNVRALMFQIPRIEVIRGASVGRLYAEQCARAAGLYITSPSRYEKKLRCEASTWNAERVLGWGAPYTIHKRKAHQLNGFEIVRTVRQPHPHTLSYILRVRGRSGYCVVIDHVLHRNVLIPRQYLVNPKFDIVNWYRKALAKINWDPLKPSSNNSDGDEPDDDDHYYYSQPRRFPLPHPGEEPKPEYYVTVEHYAEDMVVWFDPVIDGLGSSFNAVVPRGTTIINTLELNGQQVERGTYPSLQRQNIQHKNTRRNVPRPLVIVAKINGHPVRALVDSGSLGDFMSSTVAEQLKVAKVELEEPITVQLAVQGSRSKVNYTARAKFEYQNIMEDRAFDIMNLGGYDLILGTPWIYQFRVSFGLNPPRVIVGSNNSLPMVEGGSVARLASRALRTYETNLEAVRDDLREYAKPVCKSAAETPLPPLRAINHEIPLIDENAIYPWRPSRCPEALKPQWDEKRATYIKTGRWEITTATNAVMRLDFLFAEECKKVE